MRIVSLCPSLTESVFRLGKGDELVGRTKFCVQPADRVATVERVGGTKNPKLDRILALRPDVVLMNEEENRREDAEALTVAGVKIVSTFARDVAGAVAVLRQLGQVLDAGVAAEHLATQIEARAAEVASDAALRPPTSFVYLIWQNPHMAVAPGTYIDALLTVAGGRNIIPCGDNRYPEIDLHTLAADRILLSSEPFPFTERHRAELIAAGHHNVQLVDGEALSWHGARTLEGLDYAHHLFRTSLPD